MLRCLGRARPRRRRARQHTVHDLGSPGCSPFFIRDWYVPRSGVWQRDPGAHGGISFLRAETDWHTVANEDEAFYLRIAQAGGYRYPGADIGILVTRGRLQTDDHELTDRAWAWIDGIKRQFSTVPSDGVDAVPVREPEPFSFKML